MNEKYDDGDDYGDEEPYRENKPNTKKQKNGNELDDSDIDDDITSKQSNGSDLGSDTDNDDDDDDDDYSDDEADQDARNKRLFEKEKTKETHQEMNMYPGSEEDDYDDDDENDDYDENYLQKFDEKLKQNIISEYHPEMQQLNYSEVELLTTIRRDADGQIYDPLHRTLPFLTKFEKARVLGERAKQINDGAKPFVKLSTNAIDGYLIALAELEQKAIPFIIKRPLPNGGCEYWKLKDLEILI